MKKKSLILLCLAASLLNAKGVVSLQDITVTAQKQEEKLFDVPASMNIFDEFDIEDKNIDDFNDLANFSSNFSIFDAGGSGIISPSIRGITSDTSIEGSSVGIYIDGVPYIGTIGNDIPIANIERIEVLKGPQSTLYGKNSYSGAINIITKTPENSINGSIEVGVGEDNKKEISFNINTPIIEDKFLFSAFFKHYEKDGFIKNITLDNYDNFAKNDYGKIYLKYKVNDKLSVSLISSIFKTDNGSPSMNLTSAPDLRVSSSNEQGSKKLTNKSHSLNIDYSFSDFKFSSLTTMKDLKDKYFYDGDVSSLALFAYTIDYTSKEYSQEFKLSKSDDRNKYLIGVYADSIDGHRDNKMNGFPYQNFGVKSKTISLFTNNDFMLNKDFTLSVGARIDKDKIEMSDSIYSAKDSNSYTNVSPKISLKYKPQNNFMSYATISKGYKGGNYFVWAPTIEQRWYDKESLINYELGLKYAMNKDLLVSLSAFYIDVKDKQVSTILSPNVGVIDNAAKAESKGLELDLNYKINDDFDFYSTFGYNKTTFKEYKDTQGNYKGNRNPFSPKYTYTIGAKYRDANGIFANVNVKGQSEVYADKQNLSKTDAYSMVNVKLGFEQDSYEIYVYADNIANTKNDINWGTYSFPSAPREIGVKLKYRF